MTGNVSSGSSGNSQIFLFNIRCSNKSGKVELEKRFELLNQVVERAAKHKKAIVTAPEYFFSKGKYTTERTPPIPLNELEKNKIEIKLTKLSQDYPNVLIIPGTIAWLKPVRDEKFYQNWTKEERNLVRKLRGKKPKEELTSSSESYSNMKDSFRAIRDQGEDAAKSFPVEGDVMRNSLYVYCGGEQIFKYHKMMGFYESKELVYFPGDLDSPSSFNHWGLEFGVEICFDHSQGVLKSRSNDNYDIHILLSDYTTPVPEYSCIDDGYLVHSSTNENKYGVFKKDFGTLFSRTQNLKGLDRVENMLRSGDGYYYLSIYTLPEPSRSGGGIYAYITNFVSYVKSRF